WRAEEDLFLRVSRERVARSGRPEPGVSKSARGFATNDRIDPLQSRGWCRMGPRRSGVAYSRVCGASTAKRREHVWVMRRHDPRKEQWVPRLLSDRTAHSILLIETREPNTLQ